MIGEALWIERGDGAAVAHRVVACGQARLCEVDGRRQRAIQVRGERLERLVPLSELCRSAPLTAAEEAEYQRLDRELAGTIGESRRLRRFNSLRLRWLLFGWEAAE